MNTETPVLALNLPAHGGIGLIRTLGRLGVPVYAVNFTRDAPAAASRYLEELIEYNVVGEPAADSVARLKELAERIGRRPLLVTTDDGGEAFVSNNAEELQEHFTFPHQPSGLPTRLLSKRGLYEACLEHGVPTPLCSFPQARDEALEALTTAGYPLLLKAIDVPRFAQRNGIRMFIARSRDEAVAAYDRLEDPDAPNLMLQDYIPGGSETVWEFNGYFDRDSECLFGAGGVKLRQFPVRTGMTSFGALRSRPELEALTIRFAKALGYRGACDVGYRYDARDGTYKMLDFNPRVGMAFRQYVGQGGLDVVRALYLALTNQAVPVDAPAEGWLWWVEDYDARAGVSLVRERSLTLRRWIGSIRHVDEPAWFDRHDLAPFRQMVLRFVRRGRGRLQRVLLRA
jgi:D-aspartate ligase